MVVFFVVKKIIYIERTWNEKKETVVGWDVDGWDK